MISTNKILIRMLTILMVMSNQTIHARDFSTIELKVTPVSGNIYMLEGVNGFAGGNIGVSVGEDGILIVDDQFAEMSEKIRSVLQTLNPGKLRFILNTHWHGDHTGGNEFLSREATIIAHDNVRKRLMHAQDNYFSSTPARPKAAWPVITFNDSLHIHFNNETIDVLHLPNGHTDGDSIIYFKKSMVVHMGDHFFNGTFPFVDLATGGNVLSFTRNIAKIIKILPDDIKIIPGHGPLATLDDLNAYYQMLINSIDYVQSKINKGMHLEEIQILGLPEQFKSWGTGIIKERDWIMFVYQSIKSG